MVQVIIFMANINAVICFLCVLWFFQGQIVCD